MLTINISNPVSGLTLDNSVNGSSYKLLGFFYCGVGPKQVFSATYMAPSGNWVRVCTFTKEIDIPTGEQYTYNKVERRINRTVATSLMPNYDPTKPRWVQAFMERFPNVGLPPTGEPEPDLIPLTGVPDSGILNVNIELGL